jgi:hypothetical protein
LLPAARHLVGTIWGNEPSKHRSFREAACYLLYNRQHTIEPRRWPGAVSREEKLHIIAKFLHPGRNEPKGFILTTLLGIAGAFLATYTPRRSESPHFEFIGSAAGT